MYKDKTSRKAIGWANSLCYSLYCCILVMILCSCGNTHKIVYFQEPKYKGYVTSKSHKHERMLHSHFIPNNHQVNHKIVEEYNKLYEQVHKKGKINQNPTLAWMLSYLFTTVVLSLLSLLI